MNRLFIRLLCLVMIVWSCSFARGAWWSTITHESIRSSLSPRDQIMFDRVIRRIIDREQKMGSARVTALTPGLRQLAARPRTAPRLKPVILAVAQAIDHQTYKSIAPASPHPQPKAQPTPTPQPLPSQSTPTLQWPFRYEVWFSQVSRDNQDPRVKKIWPDGKDVWRVVHETSPVDTRAVLASIDAQGNPWVVFTLDGWSNDAWYITRKHVMPWAFDGVIFPSFGRAQGAFKWVVITKLDPETGKIVRGTFLMSRTTEGDINANPKANSLSVSALSFDTQGNIIITAKSWFRPFAAWSNASNYRFHPDAIDSTKNGWSWDMIITLDPTLARIIDSRIVHASLSSQATVQPTPIPQSTPTPIPTPTPEPTSQPSPTPTAWQTDMLTAVNDQRTRATIPALRINDTLARVAQAHAEDMLAKWYFSHTSQNGTTFSQRITNAGYAWSHAAENIANGQQSVSSVMDSRMNSPWHKANILNASVTEVWFWRAGDYRVQVFATPR